MTPQEAITLQSFLVALSQLDATLPPELVNGIRQIGNGLALHQPGAIASLPNIVRQHHQLQGLYELAGVTLQHQYQTLEQRIGHPPSPQVLEEMSALLENAAAQVLTAENPQTIAQAQFRQAKAKQEIGGDVAEPKAFWDCLYRTIALINEEIDAVLRALERRPLNVENLSYVLQLSTDQVKALLQYLWSAGYIDQTSGGMLHKLFPMWRRVQTLSTADLAPPTPANPNYFTLTAKGHFHLHPFVTAERRESSLL